MKNRRYSDSKVFRRILALVGIGIVILAAAFLYFQDPRPVVVAVVGLALAHIAAAVIVIYLGSSFLARLLRRIHGIPVDQTTVKQQDQVRQPEEES